VHRCSIYTREARLEAGLPICGHKDCTIPLDAPNGEGGCDAGTNDECDTGFDAGRVVTQRVTEKDVVEIVKRAEDEVFALLMTITVASSASFFPTSGDFRGCYRVGSPRRRSPKRSGGGPIVD
jgi:hypothetical protein